MKHVRMLPLVLLSATRFATGCVDTTPLHYEPPSRNVSDGGSGLDGSMLNECRSCVTDDGAPCRGDYDPCKANDRCVAFTDCLFNLGCFSLPELQDRIACGQPCFQQVGIMTSSDPALILALPINACTSPGKSCSDACQAK